MKTLSVVIPNYNNEQYISECIDSVLAQDYPINEIVIYDDASTDSSKEILKEYESNYDNIRVIYGSENKGVSFARDFAIKSTVSEYVTVIDSDDFYYTKDKISKEMMHISLEHSECVFSQTVPVDISGNPIGKVKRRALGKFVRFGIVTTLLGIYGPRDYIFPKDVYISIGGYREDMSLYEDWELNLRFLSVCNFIFSDNYGTAYRIKPGGLSSAKAINNTKAKIKAFELNKKNLCCSITEKIVFYCVVYLSYIKRRLYGEDNKR